MPVPKRKHSKSRRDQKRYLKLLRSVVQVVKSKKGNTYKRPHVEEKVKI